MKLFKCIFVAAGLLMGGEAMAQETAAVEQAQSAATQWLAQSDAGQYGASWDQAAKVFQAAITKAQWEKAVQTVRAPLGAVKSRKLKSAQYTKSLPGAPDGEYVIVQFDTQFENKASAVEKITPMKDKDGVWRVSGYYIQ